jgi:hypothetical protein
MARPLSYTQILPLYAMAMADILAFLWWVARLDAKDVEFVLARGGASEDLAA